MLVDVVPDKPVAVLILELTGFRAFPADLSQPFLQVRIAGIYFRKILLFVEVNDCLFFQFCQLHAFMLSVQGPLDKP